MLSAICHAPFATQDGSRLFVVALAAVLIGATGGCSGCSMPQPKEQLSQSEQRRKPDDKPADHLSEPEAEPAARAADAGGESAEEAANPAPPLPGRPREADGGADAGRSMNGERGGRALQGQAAGEARLGGGPNASGAVLPGGPPRAPARAAPDAAVFAGQLLDRARLAARRGDAAAAAELAIEAYEQVLPYAATDPACRRRVTEVEQFVGTVGGRAGSADSVPTRFE
jgi:hypothetical protein